VLVPAAIRALTLAASTERNAARSMIALQEVRISADLPGERGSGLLEELALSGAAIDADDAAALRAALGLEGLIGHFYSIMGLGAITALNYWYVGDKLRVYSMLLNGSWAE
jgi:hypothetical protein